MTCACVPTTSVLAGRHEPHLQKALERRHRKVQDRGGGARDKRRQENGRAESAS